MDKGWLYLVAENNSILALYRKPKCPQNTRMHIRIITDDFSSATDGLPVFASRGWATAVCLKQDALQAQVASIDTDSRTFSAESAAQAVRPWAQAWAGADLLVKQFDSTLRGPVAAEVRAVWQASGRKKLLIAPAFPAAGRTTENGKVFVNGELVHQTSFAKDPLNPVSQSSIPALFSAAGITLQMAQSPAHAIELLEYGDAVVMDASDEQALEDIVAMAWARKEILWAGSTGLLRAIASTLPEQRNAVPQWKPAAQPAIVMGSHNPRSRQQMRHVQSAFATAMVFSTPESTGDSQQLTLELTQQVSQAVIACQCDGLIVTGGETAKHIAQALLATGITVLREVEPGIPVCVLHTSQGDIPLITKAGGFGDDAVFMRCLSAIRGELV
jgi:D-threonate/D-erythronate kinase